MDGGGENNEENGERPNDLIQQHNNNDNNDNNDNNRSSNIIDVNETSKRPVIKRAYVLLSDNPVLIELIGEEDHIGSHDEEWVGSRDEEWVGSRDDERVGSRDDERVGSCDDERVGSRDDEHEMSELFVENSNPTEDDDDSYFALSCTVCDNLLKIQSEYERHLTIRVLYRLIKNLIRDPDNPKFRQISTDNKILLRHVFSYDEAVVVLHLIGFEEHSFSASGVPIWVIPSSNRSLPESQPHDSESVSLSSDGNVFHKFNSAVVQDETPQLKLWKWLTSTFEAFFGEVCLADLLAPVAQPTSDETSLSPDGRNLDCSGPVLPLTDPVLSATRQMAREKFELYRNRKAGQPVIPRTGFVGPAGRRPRNWDKRKAQREGRKGRVESNVVTLDDLNSPGWEYRISERKKNVQMGKSEGREVERPNEFPRFSEDFRRRFPTPHSISDLRRVDNDPEYIGRLALDYTNDYRRLHGLSPLYWSSGLNEIGNEHSSNMAAGSVPMGHQGNLSQKGHFHDHLFYFFYKVSEIASDVIHSVQSDRLRMLHQHMVLVILRVLLWTPGSRAQDIKKI